MSPRCHRLCGTVVVLSLAVILSAPYPCMCSADVLETSVLVEFDDAAFSAAVASAKKEVAVATIPSSTGASSHPHGPRVAAAVPGIPAAASLANHIVSTAKASRIKIRRYQSYGMVFNGMALEAETAAEANALRGLLKANPKVKKIYPVYMVHLPTYVPPTQTKESLRQKSTQSSPAAAPAAAAPAAAAAAAEPGFKVSKHLNNPQPEAAAAQQRINQNTVEDPIPATVPADSTAAAAAAASTVEPAPAAAPAQVAWEDILAAEDLAAHSVIHDQQLLDNTPSAITHLHQRQQQQRRRQRTRIRRRNRSAAAAAGTGSAIPGSSSSSREEEPVEVVLIPRGSDDTAAAAAELPVDIASSSSSRNDGITDGSRDVSNLGDPQQQQQQQYVTELIIQPTQAPAATPVLPPAATYQVLFVNDDGSISSDNSSSNSSEGLVQGTPADTADSSTSSSDDDDGSLSNPPAPSNSSQTQAPTNSSSSSDSDSKHSGGGSSSSSSNAPVRPRRGNAPYLAETDHIGGINSTVKLPLGPDGEDITYTPNLEWAAADLLTGVTELRTNFGLTGKGVRIGIIDTGIDYTHPAFGSCTAVNEPYGRCRVVAGKDMVGNDFVNGQDIPKPDNDPRDCHNSSHGTTVAGIAAAGWHPAAEMIGVAPEASLGVYKVFGCKGSAPTSAIIAAIQQAVLDGMDIINLSLSLGPGYPADPYESVMQRVYELGILATKSAGNQGALSGQGLFWVDAYTGSGSITVASADASTGTAGELAAADYSTYGPDGNLDLLPHVSSPGSNVLTTTFANLTHGYTVISGTSHATPYLSGGLALLLQLHREISRRGAFKVADAWKSVTAFQQINQTTVMQALINTATPVTSDYNPQSPAPVSKSGAGLVNFASAYFNPIEVSPSYIALPSTLQSAHEVVITVRNNLPRRGPGHPEDRTYSFVASHRGPAVAAMLSQEWGVMPLRLTDDVGPLVSVSPSMLTLGPEEAANITVTFTLPSYVRQRVWLYSGYIDLRPLVTTKMAQEPSPVEMQKLHDTVMLLRHPKARGKGRRRGKHIGISSEAVDSNHNSELPPSHHDDSSSSSSSSDAPKQDPDIHMVTAVWSPIDRWKSIWRYDKDDSPVPTPRPLVIPYQGVSRNYSSIPLIPGTSSYLDPLQPGLCYAPGDDSINVNYPEYAMDIAYDVNQCEVNTADYWVDEPIQIPLADMRRRPCDLRITMSPQLPVKRINLRIHNKHGKVLGTLPPINTPVFSRAPAYSARIDGSRGSPKMLAVYSYCLSWQGRYKPIDAAADDTDLASVVAGQTYSLVAFLEAPTAKGDEDVVPEPMQVRVPIRGRFTVVDKPSAARKRRR